MAAKEAEQVLSEKENTNCGEENEELIEDQAPGDCAKPMFIVSPSFENLLMGHTVEDDPEQLSKSQINDIVRHTSQDNEDGDSSSAENIIVNHGNANNLEDASAGEDSGEQSDVR